MPNKNWEEEFNKEFLWQSYCGDRECMHESNSGENKCFHGIENNIKNFISSLRLQDKLELIKMLPYNSLAEEEIIKQTLEDYYNK